jgi:hypothetical protein
MMRTKFSKKFMANPRIQRLWKRSTDLSRSGKRNVYVDNPEFLVYHWSGHSAGFSPATDETARLILPVTKQSTYFCRELMSMQLTILSNAK